MTRKILSSISLNFTVQVGYNNDGSVIIKKKSLNNIYHKVQESDLFVISELFKNILKDNIINTEVIEHYDITDN